MLTKKYSELYLKIYDITNNKGKNIKNIIETEEELGIELSQWKEEHIIIFLKKFNSISSASLKKNLVIMKEFSNYICKNENLNEIEYSLSNISFMLSINKEKLLSVTLSDDQFQSIRHQLGSTVEGETINYRDKLIFELAWYSLTENEIRMIKKTDIGFTKSKGGTDIAILKFASGKTVIIDDTVTIEDFKQCMASDYRISIAKDGRAKNIKYKNSEYLIRPGTSGIRTGTDYLGKPSTALKGIFETQNIVCDGIDIFKLNLDNIKRSRLIMLLSPKNEMVLDLEFVAGLYDIKSKYGIKWCKEAAILKYGECHKI